MGISGLLPLLKSIHNVTHIKKYAGQTIGIDAYGWLHRGTVACAVELALGKPTTKYVDFALSRVRMLVHFGVVPYLIFDGDRLPSKAGTEHDRAKRRRESKQAGMELYRAGKISQAHQELQKAVDVNPYMARQLIEELKRMDIQYVVAPYEADAQMVYLEGKGIINGILSEDSDLLVFGAKRLLTKLDQHGECVEICRDQFASCKDISLAGWTDAQFRQMTILSGCDYLPSISKIGLKTAYRYIRKYKNVEKVLRMLQLEKHFIVPACYLEQFQQAELTFLHHRVFCPIAKQLVFLTDLERGTLEKNLPFLGPNVDAETAIGVACGDLDPMTKESILSRSSAPSSRAGSWNLRRQTATSETNLKPSKPIDSFFQPRRQPLAELDPNSLTPSPSQQRLLNVHRNASWEARSVASAPQLRRTTSSLPNPAAPATEVRLTSDRRTFLARAATMSTFQPPKRQRLCSATEESSPTVKKSPFFANAVGEPSPSVQRRMKTKRARKNDFDIFSDDSIEDAMLLLPDLDGSVVPEKIETLEDVPKSSLGDKQAVGAGQHAAVEDVVAVAESSPLHYPLLPSGTGVLEEPSSSDTVVPPLVGESQSTRATSISADDDPEFFEDLLETHIRLQNEALRKTFVHQSPSQRAAALQSLDKPVLSDVTPPKIDALAGTFSAQSPEEQSKALRTLSPSSDSKQKGIHRKSLSETFSYMPEEQQALALASLARRQGLEEKVKLGLAAVGTAFSRTENNQPVTPGPHLGQQTVRKSVIRLNDLPTNGTGLVAEVTRRATISPIETAHRSMTTAEDSGALGSEDYLVPNSEDEGEEVLEPENGVPRPVLNLQAYAFTPIG